MQVESGMSMAVRRPETGVVRFGGGQKSDPKPKYGLRNVGYALVAAAGLAGGIKGGQVADQFHQWSHQRAQQTVSAPIQSVKDVADTALTGVAKTDNAVHSVALGRAGESLLTLYLRFSMAMVGLAALGGVFKKTIKPEELMAELHKRGITGKGIKVGVLDTGFLPSHKLKADKVAFYDPANLQAEGEMTDKVGHGTAVANIIAAGCPDAEFVVVPYITPAEEEKIDKQVADYLEQGYDNPEKLTLDGLRLLFKPMIDNIANGLRKAVDEGAQVVNVSLNVEQAVKGTIGTKIGKNYMMQGYLMLSQLPIKKGSPRDLVLEDNIAHISKWNKRLDELKKKSTDAEGVSDDVKALYKNWTEALDYAYKKNVAVVLAAGNDGGHSKDGKAQGNVNMLAAVPHPALIVVGSTNEEGTVSFFSSEFNDANKPFMAGNGSGELSTSIPSPNRAFWRKLVFPFEGLSSKLGYANPKGTSFAAPDVARTYALMKSADPSMTVDEGRTLLKEHAQPVKFNQLQQKYMIEPEIKNRLGAGTAQKEFKSTLLPMLLHNRLKTLEAVDVTKAELQFNSGGFEMEKQGDKVLVTAKKIPTPEPNTTVDISETFDLKKLLSAEKAEGDRMTAYIDKVVEQVSKVPEANIMKPDASGKSPFEKELQAELERRVGHGTIAGNRLAVVRAAEERAKAKAAQTAVPQLEVETTQTPVAKPVTTVAAKA